MPIPVVALKLFIMVHQEATEVEQSVRELQKRIDGLMTTILGRVAPKNEDSDDVRIRNAAEEIQKDVQDLQTQVTFFFHLKDHRLSSRIGHSIPSLSPSTKSKIKIDCFSFSSETSISRRSFAASMTSLLL
jgi:hypothetical protein